jgi:hypothetical protein
MHTRRTEEPIDGVGEHVEIAARSHKAFHDVGLGRGQSCDLPLTTL